MTTLFISDLHLQPNRPELTEALLRLLDTQGASLSKLFILGDLFEYWIGDDGIQPWQQPVLERLRALKEAGCQVYFQHGNRDFLIGERFASLTGAELLPEEYATEINHVPVLIMHGDSLCTRDAAYMAFRAQSRSPQWQAQILAMPLPERIKLAQSLREQSKEASSNKAEDIMDVTPEEVDNALARHNAAVMIHGHTHRPARHPLSNDAERIVLGDWDRFGWGLWIEPDTQPQDWQMIRFELSTLEPVETL
ncbi:UDP-2,3-diacylglucosamine diphosphatase [Pokkaliibacter sp. CJK22405]|uniref:UDP-2,3-diacylglucosamine diphosphatase n=1 Tax=Pokkaliibacter sp. CJK22405 TaxID=3384615 RepID=UPI0039846B80